MNKKIKIKSGSEKETKELGFFLGKKSRSGFVLCLSGDLGTGKTTFVKGMAKALAIEESQVNSPTFVLMNIYEGKLPVYHFDLYRLGNSEEIMGIGYEEYLYGEGLAVVEWAEKLEDLTPDEYLLIHFAHKKEDERLIEIKAFGKRYETLMAALYKKYNRKVKL